MTRRTAFFFDELCLWHAAGPHALTPVSYTHLRAHETS
ncbi:hypothetical protein, partial [Pseudomonas aeruginosa]